LLKRVSGFVPLAEHDGIDDSFDPDEIIVPDYYKDDNEEKTV